MAFLKNRGAKLLVSSILTSFLIFQACAPEEGLTPVPVNNIEFQPKLSDYGIYQGAMKDLVPSDGFELVELSSTLFTDYAEKQRLVKIPPGTQIIAQGDGLPLFPDGTILVKTFFYYKNAAEPSAGKRIIETRLLIKEAGKWSTGTYVWNDAQTEAVPAPAGQDMPVNWISESGVNRSTIYHVPDQRECATCHQSDFNIMPVGPKLRNLNRQVVRDGGTLNQLVHLTQIGLFESFSITTTGVLPSYKNTQNLLARRARAYLEMNCAHCHNPSGFQDAAGQDFDFRYETGLSQTGILQNSNDIREAVQSGEMPFLGTTLPDDEGIALIIEYINSL